MTEEINYLYEQSKGTISPLIFWDLTPREINDITEHENRKLKEKLFFNEDLAGQIVFGVARLLGATNEEPKSTYERYPELFNEIDREHIISAQEEAYKQRFIAFAEAHNASMRKEEELGT